MLLNLLSNAVKFTEAGEIVLSCRPTGGGESVMFGVRDTGLGIKEENLDRIFEEFTQIEGTMKEKPIGTGLGLAISRKMVEMMGGSIGVESRYGQGSLFQFAVPTGHPAEPTRCPQPKPETLDFTRKLILTVDDDMGAQEILKTYLKTEGYEVIQACNGIEALQLARKYRPFAITLDIFMPGKDGWDVLGGLKRDPQTEPIPIICISIADNRDIGLSLGAMEFLVKPVEREQLIAELRRAERRAQIRDILIVDDDPQAVALLVQYLGEFTEHTVRTAYDGREGLTMAEQHPPDLIFLDLMMPGVDGFEVIERLKTSENTRDIPIIVVSGKNLTEEETGYLNSRIQGILEKGKFTMDDLLRNVKRALEKLEEPTHEETDSGYRGQ
ncbi:MAG: response regulator [Candidatus Latescibacterota bacterium]